MQSVSKCVCVFWQDFGSDGNKSTLKLVLHSAKSTTAVFHITKTSTLVSFVYLVTQFRRPSSSSRVAGKANNTIYVLFDQPLRLTTTMVRIAKTSTLILFAYLGTQYHRPNSSSRAAGTGTHHIVQPTQQNVTGSSVVKQWVRYPEVAGSILAQFQIR